MDSACGASLVQIDAQIKMLVTISTSPLGEEGTVSCVLLHWIEVNHCPFAKIGLKPPHLQNELLMECFVI